MKKIHAKKLLLSVLCGLCLLFLAEQAGEKVYKNRRLNIQFSYPSSWILDDDSVEKTNLISLYSPEALSTKETTMELVRGIKIEIYKDEDDEESSWPNKACSLLVKGKKKLKQYCQEEASCFIISTEEKNSSGTFTFIAYIPEKQKKKEYWAIYNQVILSFGVLKNDSL